MNRLLQLWRRPVVYRTAIGLYVFLVLALAGVAFALYSFRVDGSMYVRGEVELEKNRDHGIQGRFFHAPSRTSVLPKTMEWSLEPVGEEDATGYPIEFVEGPPAETWPNSRFRIDDEVPDGEYELRVEASHEHVDEMIATREVSVTARPQPPESLQALPFGDWQARDDNPDRRISSVRRIDDEDTQGRLELAIAPADGEIVRGVPQEIAFRVFDAESGQPLAASVQLEWVQGSGPAEFEERFETGHLGLAMVDVFTANAINAVQLEATVTPSDWEAEESEEADEGDNGDGVEETPVERFEVTLLPVVTRYGIKLSSPVVTPGEELEAHVYSTLGGQEFMADLHDVEGMRFLDGVMVDLDDERTGLRFHAPSLSESSPLLHLQTYRSLYGTTHGWDGAYLLVWPDDSEEGLREAADELYAWIGEESDSAHHRRIVEEGLFEEATRTQLVEAIDAGLREIPRTFELPEAIMNTRAQDRREMDAWREEAQADLRVMMALTLIVGLVVVLYFIVLGIRRTQRENALIREIAIDTDGDDVDVEALEKGARIERAAVVLQAVIVFCTLLVFAIGIFFILSHL